MCASVRASAKADDVITSSRLPAKFNLSLEWPMHVKTTACRSFTADRLIKKFVLSASLRYVAECQVRGRDSLITTLPAVFVAQCEQPHRFYEVSPSLTVDDVQRGKGYLARHILSTRIHHGGTWPELRLRG